MTSDGEESPGTTGHTRPSVVDPMSVGKRILGD